MNSAYEMAFDAAIKEARQKFPDSEISRNSTPMGFCHVIWRHQKRILKETFGLDWQSPKELNPHIFYD